MFVFTFGPVIQAEAGYRLDKFMGVRHTLSDRPDSSTPPEATASGFEAVEVQENSIVPVSTEFGIVIEKINANARVVPEVDPANERAYSQALVSGVAQAKGSTLPGEPGNLYLFSHSVDAPWNIIRYNAIFYLLRELEPGDRIVVFHKNKRYDYIVFDKVVAEPTDVSYLNNRYDVPVLTLQTCDPPGTLLKRLVVRAKLAGS